ncbi:MAG TPA: hypothetical protein VKR58_12940 [Aquella sp.]|nr:hypothetical protein [Aquella sp.]
MNYKSKIDTHWQHNLDDSHTCTDWISRIYFESDKFSINFHPYKPDRESLKEFCDNVIASKDAVILLSNDGDIQFTTEGEVFTVYLSWPTRCGSLTYKSSRSEWILALKLLLIDLEKYPTAY